MNEGQMKCPKCNGRKKIVTFHTFSEKLDQSDVCDDDPSYGLIEDCDRCYGRGTVNDPDW